VSGERHEREAIAAADRMTGALKEVAGRLEEVNEGSEERDAALKRSGHVTRILVILAIVGFALDVAATVIALVAIHGEHVAQAVTERNSATISQLHAVNVSACQAANVTRAQEAQVWAYVISLVKVAPGATPAQRRETGQVRDGLRVHAREATAPRNCAAVYRLPRGPESSSERR
jgi:hypothetical protein